MMTRVENSCLDLFKVATLEEVTVLKLTPGTKGNEDPIYVISNPKKNRRGRGVEGEDN